MTLRRFIIPAALAFALTSNAQSSIQNPMTQAVLAVYQEQLDENPRDYNVLLNRADEYYRHTEYIRALADVDKALEFIPANETALRVRAYTLRAGIQNSMNHPDRALPDLESALALDPSQVQILAQRANTLFAIGRTADAKADYQRISRLQPRNAEAYIGLAKVAVAENNIGIANEMLETAVTLDPNNADTFIRRAQVRKAMGNHNGAVDDLVLALSINDSDPRAMAALVDYGNTNYPAAMQGLTTAVLAAPNTGMYRYLRAGLAQAHYHYLAALEDYQTILDRHLYDYHGIYASMAECEYALGRYTDALANADKALAGERGKVAYYILRSKILRALGRNEDAVGAAAAGLVVDRSSTAALTEMALADLAVGNADEASALLGEACLNDAEDPAPAMMRAWILEKYLHKPDAAGQLYNKVADMEHFYIDNPASLKGFALLFSERADQGKAWMENILNTVDDTDGHINYIGACFYAQAGDTARAMECARKALDLGYADWHDWMDKTDGRITVEPLRNDLTFLHLVTRYNAIFGR